jgi:hypothetical protein
MKQIGIYMKKVLFLFIVFLTLITHLNVSAQSTEEDFIKNTQNDLMIVAAAGAGGAILGLSTLSFVERPSNHIRNVWSGAALGMIAGVILVAYNSAQKGSEELSASSGFNTLERNSWHELSRKFNEDSDFILSSNLFHFRF